MRNLRYFSVLLLLLAPPAAAAGPAHLVADLKAKGFDSPDPSSRPAFISYLAVNGRAVFFGFLPEQGSTGCGLWATDGTPGSAEQLVDLCGAAEDFNSGPRMLAAAGTVAWFEDVAGALWRTDGTRAGTYPLGVRLGSEGPGPSHPVVGPDGKTLFFVGCAPPAVPGILQDCEPWRSDGTRQGTRRIADLVPGAAGSYPSDFTRQGRRVFFLALGSLWSTDGTAAGTRALVRLPSRYATSYLVHGSLIYLEASGEVWPSTPESAGPGGSPSSPPTTTKAIPARWPAWSSRRPPAGCSSTSSTATAAPTPCGRPTARVPAPGGSPRPAPSASRTVSCSAPPAGVSSSPRPRVTGGSGSGPSLRERGIPSSSTAAPRGVRTPT